METGNLYRKVGEHFTFNQQMLTNQAIQMTEMMNSSNYTLIIYLSDIEQKFIPYRYCVVLTNLFF